MHALVGILVDGRAGVGIVADYDNGCSCISRGQKRGYVCLGSDVVMGARGFSLLVWGIGSHFGGQNRGFVDGGNVGRLGFLRAPLLFFVYLCPSVDRRRGHSFLGWREGVL